MSINDILNSYGGEENNSLKSILNLTDDEDDNNYIQAMGHLYYYDNDQFEELLIHQKNSFNVISSNIESVNSKFDEIKLYIDMLKEKQFHISAICLQKCWISNENDITLLQINGYKCTYIAKKK